MGEEVKGKMMEEVLEKGRTVEDAEEREEGAGRLNGSRMGDRGMRGRKEEEEAGEMGRK